METHHDPVHECAELQLDTTLLSPSQAAERLSISRSRIYTLIETGQLRTVQLGRSRRIPLRAIKDFVTALDEQSPAVAHPHGTMRSEEADHGKAS